MSDRSVLVASADRLFADAAAAYLDTQPGWAAIGRETDGIAAVSVAARLRPDAVLVLGEVGRVGAADLAREVRRRHDEAAVVVVGGEGSPDATVLSAEATAEDVLAALATNSAPAGAESRDGREGIALLRSLTRQELVVLRLLAEGLTMREIAARRGVSQNTVRTHIQNLYAKLGCHNRVEVVHFANRHGVVGYRGGSNG